MPEQGLKQYPTTLKTVPLGCEFRVPLLQHRLPTKNMEPSLPYLTRNSGQKSWIHYFLDKTTVSIFPANYLLTTHIYIGT